MRSIHAAAVVVFALGACTGQPAPPTVQPPPPLEGATEAPIPAEPATDPASTEPEAPSIVPTEPRYAATHVLVAWQGAVGAGPEVTRSKAQALALARDLHAQAAGGAAIDALAREHSDDATAPRGGDLGVYATGTMVPDFEKAVASVDVGQIAPLVVTPFGYHVIRRDAVVEGHFRHILVAYQGSWRSTATRTEAEARTRMQEVLDRLSAGESFDAVAKVYSDDPSVSVNGGDLGLVAPGQLVPDFEDAAFALKPGGRSGIVRTPYGLHVIERVP
mgnify:CR=1 FL=1